MRAPPPAKQTVACDACGLRIPRADATRKLKPGVDPEPFMVEEWVHVDRAACDAELRRILNDG